MVRRRKGTVAEGGAVKNAGQYKSDTGAINDLDRSAPFDLGCKLGLEEIHPGQACELESTDDQQRRSD